VPPSENSSDSAGIWGSHVPGHRLSGVGRQIPAEVARDSHVHSRHLFARLPFSFLYRIPCLTKLGGGQASAVGLPVAVHPRLLGLAAPSGATIDHLWPTACWAMGWWGSSLQVADAVFKIAEDQDTLAIHRSCRPIFKRPTFKLPLLLSLFLATSFSSSSLSLLLAISLSSSSLSALGDIAFLNIDLGLSTIVLIWLRPITTAYALSRIM
jgi:hypothetical protein